MTDQRRRDDGVGDAAVDTAWRHAASEEPPARVDDAILAAARAEAHGNRQRRRSGGRHSWRIAWQPLAAAAGVIGLSFLLVQMLPHEEAPTPASVPAPAANTAGPAAALEEPGPARPPAAASAEKSVSQGESAASDAAGARRPDRSPLAGAAPRAAAQVDVDASIAPAAPVSPENWARRIAALHDAGELAAAAAELRAFRAAYPDADSYLPAELHAWAASERAAGHP